MVAQLFSIKGVSGEPHTHTAWSTISRLECLYYLSHYDWSTVEWRNEIKTSTLVQLMSSTARYNTHRYSASNPIVVCKGTTTPFSREPCSPLEPIAKYSRMMKLPDIRQSLISPFWHETPHYFWGQRQHYLSFKAYPRPTILVETRSFRRDDYLSDSYSTARNAPGPLSNVAQQTHTSIYLLRLQVHTPPIRIPLSIFSKNEDLESNSIIRTYPKVSCIKTTDTSFDTQ